MEHVVCKTFYKFLEIHQFVELRGHSWHRKSGNSCYRLLNHIPRWLLFHYKMRISTSVLCGFLSLLIPHQNFCLDYVDHDPHIPQVLKNTAVGWGSWCWASWASDRLAPWADLAMEDDTWSMAATSAGARWLRAAPALPEVHGQLQFRFRKSYDDRFPLPRGSSEQETRKVCRRSFHSDRSSHLLQI